MILRIFQEKEIYKGRIWTVLIVQSKVKSIHATWIKFILKQEETGSSYQAFTEGNSEPKNHGTKTMPI